MLSNDIFLIKATHDFYAFHLNYPYAFKVWYFNKFLKSDQMDTLVVNFQDFIRSI